MKQSPQKQQPDNVMSLTEKESDAVHNDLPLTLPGFDLDAGLKRLQGNRPLYIKLLAKFANGYSGIGNEIKQAVDAGDMGQTHALAHNLKGLAGNLSATTLFMAAQTLDEAVKSDAARPESQSLQAALSALLAALDEALASARGVHPDAGQPMAQDTGQVNLSAEQLLELAGKIRAAIDLGDVMSIHDSASGLAGATALAARIEELADEFDFDALLTLADELEHNASR